MLRIAGVIAVVMLSMGTAVADPGNMPPLNVNVTNASIPVTGSVTVTNMPAAQVFQPYGQTFTVDLLDGDTGSAIPFAIPEGKMLVIEYLSARISLPVGQQPALAELYVDPPGIGFSYIFLVPQLAFVGPESNRWVVGGPMRAYVTAPEFRFTRSSDVGRVLGAATATVFGYLVDAPPAQ